MLTTSSQALYQTKQVADQLQTLLCGKPRNQVNRPGHHSGDLGAQGGTSNVL